MRIAVLPCYVLGMKTPGGQSKPGKVQNKCWHIPKKAVQIRGLQKKNVKPWVYQEDQPSHRGVKRAHASSFLGILLISKLENKANSPNHVLGVFKLSNICLDSLLFPAQKLWACMFAGPAGGLLLRERAGGAGGIPGLHGKAPARSANHQPRGHLGRALFWQVGECFVGYPFLGVLCLFFGVGDVGVCFEGRPKGNQPVCRFFRLRLRFVIVWGYAFQAGSKENLHSHKESYGTLKWTRRREGIELLFE